MVAFRAERRGQTVLDKFAAEHAAMLKEAAAIVDGKYPAPVDMENIPLVIRFYTSQVVQDFFHQQYCSVKVLYLGSLFIIS